MTIKYIYCFKLEPKKKAYQYEYTLQREDYRNMAHLT